MNTVFVFVVQAAKCQRTRINQDGLEAPVRAELPAQEAPDKNKVKVDDYREGNDRTGRPNAERGAEQSRKKIIGGEKIPDKICSDQQGDGQGKQVQQQLL